MLSLSFYCRYLFVTTFVAYAYPFRLPVIYATTCGSQTPLRAYAELYSALLRVLATIPDIMRALRPASQSMRTGSMPQLGYGLAGQGHCGVLARVACPLNPR